MKLVNPYTKLRDEVLEVLRKWRYRREHVLFSWAAPTDGENSTVPFPMLYHAVSAAQLCGKRCTIEADGKSLRVVARDQIDLWDMPHVYERGEIK